MFIAWVRDSGIIVATCLGVPVIALSARGFYSSLTPKVKVPSTRGFYSSLTPKVKALSARGFYSSLTPQERGPKEDLAKKINDRVEAIKELGGLAEAAYRDRVGIQAPLIKVGLLSLVYTRTRCISLKNYNPSCISLKNYNPSLVYART
ncbi:hypothetical protein BT67DRAFT_432793 [Trichocladium antarcticum]|uniref:Uncharacterized protein n=1 Tax=Trichocladium antarcticum TaxID=1450529 RepID=A0AAN6UNT7_9PEZI|nr:hypothetical protein BT67DRAFT_432793 [Trichocladium antarcticum]